MTNNSSPISAVDLPIPTLSAKDLSDGQRLLARARCIQEDERDALKALSTYMRAARKGNVEAFRKVGKMLEEIGGSSLQDEMDFALQGAFFPHKVSEKDLEFVKQLSSSGIDAIQESDVAKLLHIANYYDVLESCEESIAETLRDSADAVSDSDWMFPEGHDDGEAIDEMPWDKD